MLLPAPPPPAWPSWIGNQEQTVSSLWKSPREARAMLRVCSKVGGTETQWGERQPRERLFGPCTMQLDPPAHILAQKAVAGGSSKSPGWEQVHTCKHTPLDFFLHHLGEFTLWVDRQEACREASMVPRALTKVECGT